MRSARLILNHAKRGSRASLGGSDLTLCATCRNATRTRRSNLMSYPPWHWTTCLLRVLAPPFRGQRSFPTASTGRAHVGSLPVLDVPATDVYSATIWSCKAGTICLAPALYPCGQACAYLGACCRRGRGGAAAVRFVVSVGDPATALYHSAKLSWQEGPPCEAG